MQGSNKNSQSKAKGNYRQELSKRQIEDIKTAFQLFDTDQTKKIDMKELKVALRALGFEPKRGEIKNLQNNLNSEGKDKDTENTNTIDFNEFMQIMELKMV